ncbi:MAG TPA: ATP-binding protein [Gemmataceae bacterium]|nr:ATP-binding protein [Gemmataceae bacterium]
MSLTARLSAFFLGSLAFVLVAFSATLYFLANAYLHRQLDGRMESALDTLVASTEIKHGLVEWEPGEHYLTLGQDSGNEHVRWLIRDGQGQEIERSPNLSAQDYPTMDWPSDSDDHVGIIIRSSPSSWRFMQRRVQANASAIAPVHGPKGAHAQDKFPLLVITGAISSAPLEATLRQLALTLAGLSSAIWLLAALFGSRLCRRAVKPMIDMATAARTMGDTDWTQRLPVPKTGDELAQLGQAFNDLLHRLYEAFERQRRFTGDASHQLRTPLTAMLGQIEVALRRERAQEEYRDTLSRVHGQAMHLRQIVEMLLFLARADHEAQLPDLEEIDLTPWFDAYAQNWTGHPRATDLQFERAFEGPARVRVQAPLLGQLIDNLVDNACKYSRPGTPIKVRLSREPGNIAWSVEDLGCGIAEADLPHVFEPFYRSPHVRRRGDAGVGLGLAVAQRIARAIGGKLSVKSEWQHGSRFTLYLPEIVAHLQRVPEQAALTPSKS